MKKLEIAVLVIIGVLTDVSAAAEAISVVPEIIGNRTNIQALEQRVSSIEAQDVSFIPDFFLLTGFRD